MGKRTGGGADSSRLATTRASVGPDGKLKKTPANRALSPRVLPDRVFNSAETVDGAFFASPRAILFNDDVEARLKKLIAAGVKVDCIVTSPPYYGQRDYGFTGQIGLEKHPAEYLDRLASVFDLCHTLLSDTGSLWINIGDTYWSGKGAAKGVDEKQSARRFGSRPQDGPGDGKWARPKQLLLLPHRLAIALQDRGWLLRNDNVWVKPNPLPDQVRDRCSMSHEYVFHLVKSRWYYFDRTKIGSKSSTGSYLPPVDTWLVPTSKGASKTHRASFSPELLKIPILGSTPRRGIVLDPFVGSGTTMRFALENGFRTIGIDASTKFCRETKDMLIEGGF